VHRALVLTLMACGQAPDTRCGMTIDTYLSNWLKPQVLQTTETWFLDAFGAESCQWFDGLRVVPVATETFTDPWGRTVYGIAYPGKDLLTNKHTPGDTVEVGVGGPLAHELVHIVQGGVGAPPCIPEGGPHCGWYGPGGIESVLQGAP
jgi:hypothetical protein